MSGALESQCLACVMYHSGDALGRLLAAACLAPYFAVYTFALLAYSTRCAAALRSDARGSTSAPLGRPVRAAEHSAQRGSLWPAGRSTLCWPL
jgi:hypothetical protein